jgi:tRNA-2-methylthio-N6-dimethylallyladenosine synthase
MSNTDVDISDIKTLDNGNKLIGDIEFPPRKMWVKTYGCQMNYHDTERMVSHLQPLNFSLTDNREEADFMVFNTCAIRDLANQKFYSHLGGAKHDKAAREVKIAAAGCIAQTESKELLTKYKQLDFAFGTDVIDNIADMVYRAYAGEKKFSVTSWDKSANYSIETKRTPGTPQAFVNIIKGCDKFCSYCIVPFTRGREKSRSVSEIVNDVARLVKHDGVQEITLLGQNVNSYGKKNGESLAELIMELEKINGLEIIRYTTSHPYDISDELIAVHGTSKKLSNHLHLPVQSGSNTVLQRMLREYSVEHYMERLEKIRAANPDIIISTDIIAGFPNETEEEHRDTLKLLKNAKYDFIYSYNYSSRKGTKSSKMTDVLTKEIRSRRLQEIQKLQLELQVESRALMVGNTYRVLVEGFGTMKGIKKWKGRSDCSRIIHFVAQVGQEDKDYTWQWVDLKVTSTTALSCQGEIVKVYGKRLTPESEL